MINPRGTATIIAKIKPTAFARFNVGEGIEKEETDYAEEVAAMAAGN